MLWRKKKSLQGIAQQLQDSPEEDIIETAKKLRAIASEMMFQKKFADARTATEEAILLFERIPNPDRYLSGCYALLEEILKGTGEHGKAMEARRAAIKYSPLGLHPRIEQEIRKQVRQLAYYAFQFLISPHSHPAVRSR